MFNDYRSIQKWGWVGVSSAVVGIAVWIGINLQSDCWDTKGGPGMALVIAMSLFVGVVALLAIIILGSLGITLFRRYPRTATVFIFMAGAIAVFFFISCFFGILIQGEFICKQPTILEYLFCCLAFLMTFPFFVGLKLMFSEIKNSKTRFTVFIIALILVFLLLAMDFFL